MYSNNCMQNSLTQFLNMSYMTNIASNSGFVLPQAAFCFLRLNVITVAICSGPLEQWLHWCVEHLKISYPICFIYQGILGHNFP